MFPSLARLPLDLAAHQVAEESGPETSKVSAGL